VESLKRNVLSPRGHNTVFFQEERELPQLGGRWSIGTKKNKKWLGSWGDNDLSLRRITLEEKLKGSSSFLAPREL